MKFGQPRTVPYDHEPSTRERIGLWFLGITPEPIIPWEHPRVKKDGPTSGVCCSGGGIRSAAFNLGALQAMQDLKVLEEMDYLAAVSGGSYIAAAHTMVRKETDQPLLQGSPAFAPGSPEERYLRNRTQYLAPGIGGEYYLAWRGLRGGGPMVPLRGPPGTLGAFREGTPGPGAGAVCIGAGRMGGGRWGSGRPTGGGVGTGIETAATGSPPTAAGAWPSDVAAALIESRSTTSAPRVW